MFAALAWIIAVASGKIALLKWGFRVPTVTTNAAGLIASTNTLLALVIGSKVKTIMAGSI
jgi:hypothetical protein